MSSLNKQQSIWITDEQLGTVQTLRHRGRSIQYRVPQEIENQITLRFKGYGKTRNGETGDLLLLIRVDRGRNVEAALWLSQTEARSGCEKNLLFGGQTVSVPVPCGSKDGQVVRVKQAGKRLPYQWGLPIIGRRRGDLLVKLRVFVETIVPNYRDADRLTTEDLSIESWIYRRSDEVLEKIGNRPHTLPPFTSLDAANLFNQSGWQGIAKTLIQRLGLGSAPVQFKTSTSLSMPGQCQVYVTKKTFGEDIRYAVVIRSDFLSDPFAVTAILAHELCHIIEARAYNRQAATGKLAGTALLEMERTVDLLVFLFQLGEFQMRVARDRSMTLGYFNQELFERMHVILSRKRDAYTKGKPLV